MYTIAGIFSKKGNKSGHKLLTEATESLDYWNSVYSGSWSDEHLAIGAFMSKGWHNRDRHKPLIFDNSSNYSIVANARLDYKEELVTALDEGQISDLSDEELILKAYLKFGKDCLDYLFGDFAFAIWDAWEKKLFCARDHFGCRPFYYYESEDSFIFSTDIRALLAFPGIETTIQDKYIVDCMLELPASGVYTAYDLINKLPPAHRVLVSRGEPCITERYWALSPNQKPMKIDEDKAILGLKERFIAAVNERVKDCGEVAIELSGGLDSSAIAAAVSYTSGAAEIDIHTFTHAMDDNTRASYFPYTDQREEVKQVADRYNFSSQHYITGIQQEGIVDSITESLLIYRRPLVQSVATMSHQLYNSVRSNDIHVLLSGFGGDEGVTIQGSGLLNELIRKRRWEEFRVEVSKKAESEGSHYQWTFLKTVLRVWMPAPMRYLKRLKIGHDVWKNRYRTSPVVRKLKVEHHTRSRYFKHFRRFRRNKDDDVKKYLYFKLHMNSIENRLEESYLITQAKEIEYRYPLLDVKLVEYFYSLPSTLMYHTGVGRYAFRKAVNDMLPREIVWRRSKTDATIPYILCLIDREEDKIKEVIRDAVDNNSFHYVDSRKLQSIIGLLKGPRKGLASSIGPRALYNSLSVLILQKMQREGKIDIGIKC